MTKGRGRLAHRKANQPKLNNIIPLARREWISPPITVSLPPLQLNRNSNAVSHIFRRTMLE